MEQYLAMMESWKLFFKKQKLDGVFEGGEESSWVLKTINNCNYLGAEENDKRRGWRMVNYLVQVQFTFADLWDCASLHLTDLHLAM